MPVRVRQFLWFAGIGVVGFVVDASIVFALVRGAGVNPYLARVASFCAAVTTTWFLNRTLNFRSARPPLREFAGFLAANSVGAAVNFGAYSLVIARIGTQGLAPVTAVGVGSIAGLGVNFLLSSRLVFSADKNEAHADL
ncbi:MAG: GtrA family protein [Gemmatimonadaceae bacterium]|nr:GtrA family protein [Gemmatimonadaceae bacterium]